MSDTDRVKRIKEFTDKLTALSQEYGISIFSHNDINLLDVENGDFGRYIYTNRFQEIEWEPCFD